MINALFNTKRANGKAPHKPILLLALTHEISGIKSFNCLFLPGQLHSTKQTMKTHFSGILQTMDASGIYDTKIPQSQ